MQLLKNLQQDKTGIQLHRKGCANQTRKVVTSENKSFYIYIYSNVDKSFLPWYW